MGCTMKKGSIRHSRNWKYIHTIINTNKYIQFYLGKLKFRSVTDFSPGKLPRENVFHRCLNMSREQ